MGILVYTESENGSFKKNAFEVASYASALGKQLEVPVTAVAVNNDNPGLLGSYGVNQVLQVQDDRLKTFNAKAITEVLVQAAGAHKSDIVILSSSADARYLAGQLAGRLQAGYAPNAVELPSATQPLVVKRTVFSNKGFAHTKILSDTAIIGVSNNAFGAVEQAVEAKVTPFAPELEDGFFATASIEIDKVAGKATIADADIIVSGGRGLKGPENWGMIEELAEVLGAATACSKPVSDLGWRPHSEHVGQTGKPVASNLYIAIGISGAIQHLAGVNAAKVKVVINIDPEAPFFKAADYGIVGDAFEVVPKLTEKLKEFKSQDT